jgi:hypothetical protein
VVGAKVVVVVVVVELLVLVVLVVVDVLVDVEVLVLVLVLVEELLLVVVVVGVSKFILKLIKFVHNPVDITLIVVASLGTVELYPACNAAADTFVANGTVYPSESE